MRKMVVLLVSVMIMFWGVGNVVSAAELELAPYVKGGTIAWDQLEGIGGHKSIVAGGLNVNAKFYSLGAGATLEKWWVSEGMDDDKGLIPKEGYSLLTDVKYFFKVDENILLYPYAGVGFEGWDKGKEWRDWKSVRFFNWTIGAGLESEKGYIKAGVTKPFSMSTQNGLEPKSRYGFSVESGIKLKDFRIGLFYKYAGLEDPDAKMTQSGLFIGYSF